MESKPVSADEGGPQPSAERPARSGRKGPAAFRTIGEASEELGVPQHVLRFWETKFTQLKPLKRAGGRRYYRPEDMALLTRIRDLLYQEGFTIKGARRHLRQKGGNAVEAEQELDGQEVSTAAEEEEAPVLAAAPAEPVAESVPPEPPPAAPAPLFEASERAEEADRLRDALRSLHAELVDLRRSLGAPAPGPS